MKEDRNQKSDKIRLILQQGVIKAGNEVLAGPIPEIEFPADQTLGLYLIFNAQFCQHFESGRVCRGGSWVGQQAFLPFKYGDGNSSLGQTHGADETHRSGAGNQDLFFIIHGSGGCSCFDPHHGLFTLRQRVRISRLLNQWSAIISMKALHGQTR